MTTTTEREIGRTRLQPAAAGRTGAARRCDAIGSPEQLVEQGVPGVGRQPAVAPAVDLGEDEAREDRILACVGQESGAALVIGIRGVAHDVAEPPATARDAVWLATLERTWHAAPAPSRGPAPSSRATNF